MDSDTATKVKEYQRKICGIKKDKATLGTRYFYNFMSRHKDILHTTKVSKKCISRL
jgi:hypothetical protein